MRTALFPSELSATLYRDACNVADGLPKPGVPFADYPHGWTLQWADVREDNGAWPIPVHPAVPVPDGVPVLHVSADLA